MLSVGTRVSWPDAPFGRRRGVIVKIIPPGTKPDFAPFDGRGYSVRPVFSYLVREDGRGGAGRLMWPWQDHLLPTGEPPAIVPLTAEERQWCEANPDAIRALITASASWPVPR